MFKELFWVKIWYIIDTHNVLGHAIAWLGFKTPASGMKLRGFWRNCVAHAPL